MMEGMQEIIGKLKSLDQKAKEDEQQVQKVSDAIKKAERDIAMLLKTKETLESELHLIQLELQSINAEKCRIDIQTKDLRENKIPKAKKMLQETREKTVMKKLKFDSIKEQVDNAIKSLEESKEQMDNKTKGAKILLKRFHALMRREVRARGISLDLPQRSMETNKTEIAFQEPTVILPEIQDDNSIEKVTSKRQEMSPIVLNLDDFEEEENEYPIPSVKRLKEEALDIEDDMSNAGGDGVRRSLEKEFDECAVGRSHVNFHPGYGIERFFPRIKKEDRK
jgi:DNA repair exonuclease SbcCD ATPase subunit